MAGIETIMLQRISQVKIEFRYLSLPVVLGVASDGRLVVFSPPHLSYLT